MQPLDPARRNNLDLLRLALALIVVLFHAQTLSRLPVLEHNLFWANGTLATMGFFAISGYAVSLSWERSRSFAAYAARRLRRILPAYIAVVVLCWLAGAAISTLGPVSYWLNPASWRYLFANFTFAQFLGPSLPGVFAQNPWGDAVNGSLWSIRTELVCYALAPLLVSVGWVSPLVLAIGFASGSWLLSIPAGHGAPVELAYGLAYPLACFAFGVLLRHARPALVGWGFIGAAFLIPHLSLPGGVYVEALAAAAVVMALALAAPRLGHWPLAGNLSYGIYLWHFPLAQWFTSIGWQHNAPWLFLASLLVITFGAATASWFLFERRFLRA